MIGPETRRALVTLNERLTHPPLNTNPANPTPNVSFADEDRMLAAFIDALASELDSLRRETESLQEQIGGVA